MAKDRRGELVLYGPVDRMFGIDPKEVRDELAKFKNVDTLDVRINSEGGNIFDGLAVYNAVRGFEGKTVVHVDGMALSMGSVIAMAGDEIVMSDGAMLMIHNPLWLAMGESSDLRDAADVMDKLKNQLIGVYSSRTGQSAEQIAEWMDAETWMDAADAIERGFADRSESRMAIAANFDTTRFCNVPDRLLNQVDSPTQQEPNMAEAKVPEPVTSPPSPQPATFKELKAAFPAATADFLTAQLEADATIDQARAAYTKALEERAAAAEAKAQEAEAKAAEQAQAQADHHKSPGVDGLPEGQGQSTDTDAGDFRALVAERARERNIPTHLAARQIAREHPEARQAAVAEHNAQHARSR